MKYIEICTKIFIEIIYWNIYRYIIRNFYSRLRRIRSFVLSAAARALTTEAPILDPFLLSFFLALWALISPKKLNKSRKKRYQGSISRADANGSKKTCDLGLLKTSQTKPASMREHDFRVLALCRKSCIWELLWTFILERLWAPTLRKQGFNGCLKIALFFKRFLKHFGLPKIC